MSGRANHPQGSSGHFRCTGLRNDVVVRIPRRGSYYHSYPTTVIVAKPDCSTVRVVGRTLREFVLPRRSPIPFSERGRTNPAGIRPTTRKNAPVPKHGGVPNRRTAKLKSAKSRLISLIRDYWICSPSTLTASLMVMSFFRFFVKREARFTRTESPPRACTSAVRGENAKLDRFFWAAS